MANTITVAPGLKLQAGEVAIWEVNSEHPDGEIMISAPHPGEETRTFTVARTPGVNARLADGRLVESAEQPKPEPIRSPSPVAAVTTTAPTGNVLDTPGLLTDAQRAALAAAGIVTAEDIRSATDEKLTGVDGIGPATVTRLREAVRE